MVDGFFANSSKGNHKIDLMFRYYGPGFLLWHYKMITMMLTVKLSSFP